MARRIEDYALIGDCESAALVSRDGSIDWLCWPRFDSGAIFAALLGDGNNRRWILTAADRGAKINRRYRGPTLILETSIETPAGSATVTDFMPRRGGGMGDIIRIVEGRRGKVNMETELVFRFDYGLIVPWITRVSEGLKAVAGPDMVVLRTSAPIEAKGYKHCGSFTVEAGETVTFVLSHGDSFRDIPPAPDPMSALEETEQATKRGRMNAK